MKRYKVVIIAGPTCVGKTLIAHKIALLLKGEIISADSRKIYKYLDIGTAKPKDCFFKDVVYHLISIIPPTQDYSAYEFKRSAEKLIMEITQKGNLPIVVGGTGLYIKALTDGIFDFPSADTGLRELLKKEPLNYLYKKLELIDKESAKKISPRDSFRIIRALEVYYLTGRPISYHQKYNTKRPDFDFIKIFLSLERKKLYQRIEKRCEAMIKEGLLDEIKQLLKEYPPDLLKRKGIGYKELTEYLCQEGKFSSLSDAISAMKRHTKLYAKRQIAWFKNTDFIWFDIEKISFDSLLNFIKSKIKIALLFLLIDCLFWHLYYLIQS